MQYEIVEGQWLSDGKAILSGPGSKSFDDAIRTKLRAGWRLWGGIQVSQGSSGTNETVSQALVKDGTPSQLDYKLMTFRPPYRPHWSKDPPAQTISDYVRSGWVPFGPPSGTSQNSWQALTKVAKPAPPKAEPVEMDDGMEGVSEFKQLTRIGKGMRRRTARRR